MTKDQIKSVILSLRQSAESAWPNKFKQAQSQIENFGEKEPVDAKWLKRFRRYAHLSSNAQLTLLFAKESPPDYFLALPEEDRADVYGALNQWGIAYVVKLLDLQLKTLPEKQAKLVPSFITYLCTALPLEQQKDLFSDENFLRSVDREWKKWLTKFGMLRVKRIKTGRGRFTETEYDQAHDKWVKKDSQGKRVHSLIEIVRLVNPGRYGRVDFESEDGRKIIKRFRQAMRRLDHKLLPTKPLNKRTKKKLGI